MSNNTLINYSIFAGLVSGIVLLIFLFIRKPDIIDITTLTQPNVSAPTQPTYGTTAIMASILGAILTMGMVYFAVGKINGINQLGGGSDSSGISALDQIMTGSAPF